MSIQWLEYLSHTENIEIKHALNHGEDQLWLAILPQKSAMNLPAVFYHGCVKCHAQFGLNPVTRETYGVLYGQFTSKVNDLKDGHEVEVMGVRIGSSVKKDDSSIQTFLQGYRKPERMDPRQALFGGRTNAMKLYHKVSDGEKVR